MVSPKEDGWRCWWGGTPKRRMRLSIWEFVSEEFRYVGANLLCAYCCDLLAAAVAFGESYGDGEVVGEIVVVLVGEFVEQFLWRES